MRIAIVTQPLMENYGGLLQNWAMQTVLRREFPGAEVVTFDQVDNLASLYLRVGSKVKDFFMGRKKIDIPSKFDEFRTKHINATEKARFFRDFRRMDRRFKPDVCIVGSDQVWRPSMAFNLDANFLAFSKCKTKIAYAASFGINIWEFTPKETARCRKFVKDFAAVSVREKDGVALCTKYFGREARLVLDPTLLLSAEDYSVLVDDAGANEKKYAFTYILDTDAEKRSVAKGILGGMTELNGAFDIEGQKPSDRLSVEKWLVGIRDAEKVICDSFHGAAFSILFNKDFYVLANPQRGNSRLTSLLSIFGLNNRMITSIEDARSLPPVDWTTVNSRRAELIADSLTFLHTNIN